VKILIAFDSLNLFRLSLAGKGKKGKSQNQSGKQAAKGGKFGGKNGNTGNVFKDSKKGGAGRTQQPNKWNQSGGRSGNGTGGRF